MDLNLRGRTALITGASRVSAAPRAECWRRRASTSSWCRAPGRPGAARDTIAGAPQCQRARSTRCDLADSRNVDRLVADASRHRHPGQQCRRHSRRRPARDRRGALARGLGPEGLRLHQHVPPLLCRDEARAAAASSSTSSAWPARRSTRLYRRLHRQCRADGVHQALGGSRRRRQPARRRHQSRRDLDRPLVTLMKTRAQDRFGDENRWQELMKPLPWAGRHARRDRRRWWPFSHPTCRPTRPARSSPSTAARPIAGRCSKGRRDRT